MSESEYAALLGASQSAGSYRVAGVGARATPATARHHLQRHDLQPQQVSSGQGMVIGARHPR